MRLAGEGQKDIAAHVSDATLTVPNLISLGRLLATPVIIAFISLGWEEWAFWLFVAAALSDSLDGFLAKYGGSVSTRLGAYLDPAADKILIVGVYGTLGAAGDLPIWLVILVISRDILIVGGIMLTWILYGRTWVMPLIIGKLTTCVQMVFLAAILAERAFFFRLEEGFAQAGLYAVAFMTLFSGGLYIFQWFLRIGATPSASRSRPGARKKSAAP